MTSADRLNQLLTAKYGQLQSHHDEAIDRGCGTDEELEASKTLRLMWETFEGLDRAEARYREAINQGSLDLMFDIRQMLLNDIAAATATQ